MAGGVAPRREPATGEAELIGSLVAALVDDDADADWPDAAGPPVTINPDGDGADAAELARLLAHRLAELEASGGGSGAG